MKYIIRMKYLVLAFAIVFSAVGHAGETGFGKVKTFMSAYGGFIFTIDDVNDNPENCTKATMKLDPSNAQYDHLYSYLLTAYTTGNPIKLYTNGCDAEGYNIVTNIYSSWGL